MGCSQKYGQVLVLDCIAGPLCNLGVPKMGLYSGELSMCEQGSTVDGSGFGEHPGCEQVRGTQAQVG